MIKIVKKIGIAFTPQVDVAYAFRETLPMEWYFPVVTDQYNK